MRHQSSMLIWEINYVKLWFGLLNTRTAMLFVFYFPVPLHCEPLVVCAGSAQGNVCVGALWEIWCERSLPGPAEGQRGSSQLCSGQRKWCKLFTETRDRQQTLWSTDHAQAGGGTLQENAGEDVETACSCWEQAQKGEPDDGVVEGLDKWTAACRVFINTLFTKLNGDHDPEMLCVPDLSLYAPNDTCCHTVILFSL